MSKPCSGCGVEHKWGSCSGKPARYPMLRRLAERLRERGWAKLVQRQEKRDLVEYAFAVGQFGSQLVVHDGQELSGADFSQQGHEDITPLEPDVEARARAGSF